MTAQPDGMPVSGAMCPHCGAIVATENRLTVVHAETPSTICPGSTQIPRNPLSDRRRLWNGQANPHADVSPTPQPERCPTCDGTGGDPLSSPDPDPESSFYGQPTSPCLTCNGTGQLDVSPNIGGQ